MEKITIEKCKEESLKYKTKYAFYKQGRKYYEFAKKNGIFDIVTSHMKYKRSSIDENYAIKIAKQYNTIKDFKKDNKKLYNFIAYKKLQDKAYSHMEKVGNRYKRCVYVYEFPNNICYVGLTFNVNKRNSLHNTNEKSPVFKYANSNNIEIPQPKQLTDYINKEDASKLEIFYSEKYKKDGWKLLNRIKCGSLGGLTDNKTIYTKDYCKNLALNYKTKTDFRKENHYLYNKILEHNWSDFCFEHMSSEVSKQIKSKKISSSKKGKKMNITNIENFKKAHSRGYILQFDLNGNFIQKFYSANEAARQITGDKKNSNGILNVCNGKSKTYKGYIWKYDKNYVKKSYKIKNNKGNSKVIQQFDLNGKFIKEYPSMTKAAIEIKNKKSSFQSISLCCRKKIDNAFGYIWKYKEL